MIDSITLKGVASYSADNPATFQTNGKKVNLFYGLNGSGKSTIGKFLQSTGDEKYAYCSILPPQQQEDILVYNQDFIRKNFYEIPDFQGVFTLSETNHTAEQAIELATTELAKIEKEEETTQNKITNKNRDIAIEEENLKDSIWKSKTKHERTELNFCLEGFKRKDTFLQKVKSSKGMTTETIDSLIERMNNSDWVKTGLSYLKQDEPCPFCQQELNVSIVKAIEELFDETYQSKQDEIKVLYQDYSAGIDTIENIFNTSRYTFDNNLNDYGFDSKKELLVNTLKFNLKQLEDKRRFSR
ncbi:AAA family ATPase [Vibrio sp. 10N.261.45.A4]|uniref:AAA family ATPase n=1 Tax=Vibrio sp. 10N.261.45.A4 TaxID=3229655 RepID=UPI00354DA8D1